MDTLEIIVVVWLILAQPTLAIGMVAGYALGRYDIALVRRS